MKGLPAGPRMAPALQTVLWVRRPQWMLDQSATRFGDTFTLRLLGLPPWVVVSHPRDVEAVFRGDPDVLHAGESNRILGPVLGESSVLLLDGRSHLEQRRLMLPAFHGRVMGHYREVIAEVARDEIAAWPAGEVQRLYPRMQTLTLEVILRAVLGVGAGGRHDALRAALSHLIAMLTAPHWALAFIGLGPDRVARLSAFKRHMVEVDSLLLAEIADRRAALAAGDGEREDIMSLLLSARHEDGSAMDDREVRDELLTLLAAGHETTATALAWAGERLVRHPQALGRLAEEARAGAETTYATAVAHETLRLRPVISIVHRVLTQPWSVGGRELPAGAIVAPALYLVNRRPDLYDDPEAFLPERFVGRAPGTYTWIPFGGGTRRCLGAAFAQLEMETVLHQLALRLVARPVRPEPEPIVRRGVTATPRYGGEVLVA